MISELCLLFTEREIAIGSLWIAWRMLSLPAKFNLPDEEFTSLLDERLLKGFVDYFVDMETWNLEVENALRSKLFGAKHATGNDAFSSSPFMTASPFGDFNAMLSSTNRLLGTPSNPHLLSSAPFPSGLPLGSGDSTASTSFIGGMAGGGDISLHASSILVGGGVSGVVGTAHGLGVALLPFSDTTGIFPPSIPMFGGASVNPLTTVATSSSSMTFSSASVSGVNASSS